MGCLKVVFKLFAVLMFFFVGIWLAGTVIMIQRGEKPPARRASAMPSSGLLSDGTSYTIISDQSFRRVKRSLAIRLEKPADKSALTSFAVKVRGNDQGKFDKTYIEFYLPGDVLNSGAWAVSHFTPEMEFRFVPR